MDISNDYIEQLKNLLPELPEKRFIRFTNDIKLPGEIARILIKNKVVADYFEESLKYENNPKLISSWITTDIMGYLNRNNINFIDLSIDAKSLATLAKSVSDSQINEYTAKSILLKSISSNDHIDDLLKSEISNSVTSENLLEIIEKVLRIEEEQFGKTLERGLAILEKSLSELKGDVIPGDLVIFP